MAGAGKAICHGGRPVGKFAVMELVKCNLPLTLPPAVATLQLSVARLPLMLTAPVPLMAVTVSLTVPLKPTVMEARMPVVEPPREAC